jgi:hypothetical protein
MYQRGGPPDFSPEMWLCEKEKLDLGKSVYFSPFSSLVLV